MINHETFIHFTLFYLIYIIFYLFDLSKVFHKAFILILSKFN
jgi:hypothetical protein